MTRLRMLNWAEHVFDEKMLSSTRSVPLFVATCRIMHPFMSLFGAGDALLHNHPSTDSQPVRLPALLLLFLASRLTVASPCVLLSRRDDLLDTGAGDESDDE